MSSPSEKIAAFCRYDFSGDERWLEVERSWTFVGADERQRHRALIKRKKKFYKQHIDTDFNINLDVDGNGESGSSSTDSGSRSESESSSPRNAHSASSSSASASPRTSPSSTSSSSSFRPSSPRSPYLMYLSWLQLALHMVILLSVLTYVLPLAGVAAQTPSFSRVLMLNIIAQAIYIMRQHGRPRWSAEYGRALAADEQAHFFFVSFLLISAGPSLILLGPFALRSTLFVCGGIKQVLPNRAPRVYNLIARPVEAVVSRYSQLYSQVALLEVFGFFQLLLALFTPQRNILTLFGYGQYMRARYMLSSDSKRAWGMVRTKTDGWAYHPSCPTVVRGVYDKVKTWMASYTDEAELQRQAQQQQQGGGGGGLMSRCNIM